MERDTIEREEERNVNFCCFRDTIQWRREKQGVGGRCKCTSRVSIKRRGNERNWEDEERSRKGFQQ